MNVNLTGSMKQNRTGRKKSGANGDLASDGQSPLVSLALRHPMGQQTLHGSLQVPAGDEVEKDLPDFLDAFARAVQGAPNDQDNLPPRFADAPVMETTTKLLQNLSRRAGPVQTDEDGMGYNLLPTRVERGEAPGLLAVDLAPATYDLDKGSVVSSPVARLFLDTTPGVDGIQYLLSY